MDLKMNSTTIGTSSAFPVWDIDVVNGVAQIVTGDAEHVQKASMAAFIQVGSVPQLPGVGVPWVEFLTGGANFADLDAAIRKAAQAVDEPNFSPNYDFENGRLVVTMQATRGAQ
jgi:hypothetical protein